MSYQFFRVYIIINAKKDGMGITFFCLYIWVNEFFIQILSSGFISVW